MKLSGTKQNTLCCVFKVVGKCIHWCAILPVLIDYVFEFYRDMPMSSLMAHESKAMPNSLKLMLFGASKGTVP